MAIEVNSTNVVCTRCGKSYSRRKGYFAVNYGNSYKGIGHLSICKDCVDDIYNGYLSQCNSVKDAVRQTCRKLDIYWNEKTFDIVEKKTATRTIMTGYLSKITSVSYAGKSYDDTLSEEGKLWDFTKENIIEIEPEPEETVEVNTVEENIPKEIISFWGKGYTAEDYEELETSRAQWLSSFTDSGSIGIAMQKIIKQICLLELDMDKERFSGSAPSEKTYKAYTDLLGSANLKPVQKQKEDNDTQLYNTPMGVWLDRFEDKRPLPDKYDDSSLLKYIFIWLGHTLRMLGKKNAYTQLYQEEIDRLRVERPEYEDEEDEAVMIDYFNSGTEESNG